MWERSQVTLIWKIRIGVEMLEIENEFTQRVKSNGKIILFPDLGICFISFPVLDRENTNMCKYDNIN